MSLTERIAQWLAASECEALLRGTSAHLQNVADYESLEGGRYSRAAIVRENSGEAVGIAHFWRLRENTYEVGGAVGDPKLWASGVGIEAGLLLVDYLFEVLGAHRVEFTSGMHNASMMALCRTDTDLRIEAICDGFFQTASGPVAAVKSALTRDEYYETVLEFQPRVGRRIDHDALDRLIGDVIDRRIAVGTPSTRGTP